MIEWLGFSMIPSALNPNPASDPDPKPDAELAVIA